MLFCVCILINIFIAIYFIAKKKAVVAFFFSLSFCTMAFLSLFYIENSALQDFLQEKLGETYKDIIYLLENFGQASLAPYLGVELLTLVIALVVTIKAAAKLVVIVAKSTKVDARIIKQNDLCIVCADENTAENKRIYLLNCQMLC